MTRFIQGIFIPKNPQKYVGQGKIEFRSSWEKVFMEKCDQHPNIIQWASEPIKIPYIDPVGKKRNYIPDFLISYIDKDGIKKCEMIEIKPFRQTMIEAAKTRKDKIAVAKNTAKWKYANAWCVEKGIIFRVLTEKHLFQNTGR